MGARGQNAKWMEGKGMSGCLHMCCEMERIGSESRRVQFCNNIPTFVPQDWGILRKDNDWLSSGI